MDQSILRECVREILIEGRYDRLTGLIVQDIWTRIRDSFGKEGIFKDKWKYSNPFKFPIDFKVDLEITRDPRLDHHVSVEGFSYKDSLEIKIWFKPQIEKKTYQYVNSRLHDTVIHELEHILQWNEYGGRDIPDEIELLLQSMGMDGSDYFLYAHEIPAMTRGLYKKAKVEKRPFTEVVEEYLNSMIEQGDLEVERKEEVIQAWFDYARKHLPAAQLSEGKYTLTAPLRSDLEIAANWVMNNDKKATSSKVRKSKDGTYSLTVTSSLPKQKVEYLTSSRFGRFVKVK
jgi:hypothetical protein